MPRLTDMRYVLLGDAQSPHLLKWTRALAPQVELWVASSRGFDAGYDDWVPAERRLALNTRTRHGGGNVGLLLKLPELAAWLRQVDPDCINAHYLTSHGTLAWLAKRLWRLRARLVGSAWGSDILVTPQRGAVYRWLTSRVLRACELCTSDSEYMSERMRELGASEVLTFPFGLEAMPERNETKQPWLFFANRGLEPIYRPDLVIDAFAEIVKWRPEARLIVAHDGSLRGALERQVQDAGLADRVEFVGRLDAGSQAVCYGRAQWYLSLPTSDALSVSVLEAMAHGCVPLLSDLPANRELISSSARGLIVDVGNFQALPAQLELLSRDADLIGGINRDWVACHGLFAPGIERLLRRLSELP